MHAFRSRQRNVLIKQWCIKLAMPPSYGNVNDAAVETVTSVYSTRMVNFDCLFYTDTQKNSALRNTKHQNKRLFFLLFMRQVIFLAIGLAHRTIFEKLLTNLIAMLLTIGILFMH